jgi:AraC family transcriptional regulator, melibiose operon regulatory protein
MANDNDGLKKAVPAVPDRRFYSRTKAFGRFGMRIFKPTTMERPHWHGHVEANLVRNARMIYVVDGQRVIVEPDQLVVFWAGIPHQLIAVEKTAENEAELMNIYLPLDTFLFMHHVPELQVALLTGGIIQFNHDLCTPEQVKRWYGDYRANDPERLDIVKMELNAVFRRVSLGPMPYLKKPWREKPTEVGLPTPHVRHVVDMVRHVLENIEVPLQNKDVTKITGLHTNYALSLFSSTMQLPLKQFIIRMRLLKARGLLLESDTAISTVAVQCGFGSASQFFAQFKAAYGTSPQNLRSSYLRLSRS